MWSVRPFVYIILTLFTARVMTVLYVYKRLMGGQTGRTDFLGRRGFSRKTKKKRVRLDAGSTRPCKTRGGRIYDRAKRFIIDYART